MDLSTVTIVKGNLLEQKTDAIVNAWNRNIIPWWLLIPHGVSGAIKKEAGISPFVEVAKFGPIPLGEAVVTRAGKLPYKFIIHVASINMMWRASEYSISMSVINAIRAAEESHVKSLAFPVLGSGAGGFTTKQALQIMTDTLQKLETSVAITIVRL